MEDIGEFPWTIFFSHPLFSCFITIYSLFLLYFPHDSLRLLLSPVPLLAGAFLVSLLRFGSTRESKIRPGRHESRGDGRKLEDFDDGEEPKAPDPESEWNLVGSGPETGLDSVSFVNLKLGGILEVIHEEEEEEEEEPNRFVRIDTFKPDYDSELDSRVPVLGGSVSSAEVRLILEEEESERGEGLIEIKLDDNLNGYRNDKIIEQNQIDLDFHAEEESLIEIDISS